MSTPQPQHIMAALVGSAGSGMTTIVEAVLHRAGAIPRPGSIEQGTTVGDFQPEEVARKTTLSPALTYLDWTDPDGKPYALTLADTPGHPDFIGAVDASLSAADLAVVVVSAVAGVTAGTRAGWAAADAAGLPRFVLVTCADRPQANFHRVLAELRETFGSHLWPVSIPLGQEEDFTGIADVLGKRALVYTDGVHKVTQLPSNVASETQDAYDTATEEIVSHYDALLEAYLEGNEPEFAELERRLAERIVAGDAVPVIVASGITETGVDRFIDTLCRCVPALAGRDTQIVASDGTEISVATKPDGDPLVHVFSTVADPFLGQISMLKVLSGTISAGQRLRNATTGSEERLGNLFRLRGAEHLPVSQLRAGEVGAVAKLADTPAGSLLWTRPTGHACPRPLPVRPPVYSVVLEPATQADTEKLSTALQRMVAEDPTLRVDREAGLTIVRGLGETHIAVATDRLKRIFNVSVNSSPAPIAYRETIAARVEVEGKVKKQSGGHGQFAVVQLIVSPRKNGEGFEFVDKVVGGSVPRNYIPAVEKGALDALQRGGPQGFPIVDIRVELVDGKAHSVDSSEMAFRTAGALGVGEAMRQAGSVVLEPICLVEVTVPLEYQGAIMTDLAGRRGRVSDTRMEDNGDTTVIAAVPEAELDRYVLDLRSLTAGHARLVISPDHYERLTKPLPGKAGPKG